MPYIFLIIILLIIAYILFRYRENYELLVLLPFIFATNFLGFLDFNFNIKGVVQNDDITFFIIIIVTLLFWKKDVYLKERSRFYYNIGYLFIALLIYFVIVLLLSFYQYEDYIATLKISRIFLRYSIFFSFYYIIVRIDKPGIERLMEIVEKGTLFLTLLFILHSGFGLPIFGITDKSNLYAGDLVERSFATFPIFSFVVLARLSLKEKINFYNITGILAILFSIFLLITRSLLGAGIIVVLAGFYFRNVIIIKSKRIGKLIITFALIGTLFIILLLTVFQQQVTYFLYKSSSITSVEAVYEGTSLYNRVQVIESRFNKVIDVNPFTGLGMLHPEEARKIFYPDLFVRTGDRQGSVIVGDQSWGSFLGSVGIIGVLLYLSLIFYPVIYLKKRGIFYNLHHDFYAVLIGLFIETCVRGFFSRSLFTGVFFISFLFSLLIYYIELYYNEQPKKFQTS
ncbi:MAG: hypothetical protein Kow0098_14230 [Ignavibacteriaceae bacterium]